ncbi:MucB/RseB C-terminal domain-containing protein [Colwellia sp. UCD-KL20]|uniref:MucB/RseB C-terminal domain-containing protein n=1 Tax=Colwellia sp. UCD-KL20 TaxID=1917165 RepID=UPI000970F227|nr:MucB/RseB C-terminal domain-containing protein [Colwellia sp. UCD-KL20]
MRTLICVLLLSTGFSTIAAEVEQQASTWLNALSQSLKTRNFSTSFVVIKNNHAEPYHWFHGVDDTGKELEILSLLNGPRRDVLRKDGVVSYIEPELPPYSVETYQVSGPIPSIFSGDISSLEKSYNFISLGKSRVLGRPAQIIRIVSKDKNRFGYRLWLDQESNMLLKMSVITREGIVLEQVQFTHLEFSKDLPEPLKQLQVTDLPHVVDVPKGIIDGDLQWKVNWLPSGFENIRSNYHRLSITKQATEFMLFSDGLVDVSIYINKSPVNQREPEFVMNGATGVYSQVVKGVEVSVVGKIPSMTAQAIADSVSLLPSAKRP